MNSKCVLLIDDETTIQEVVQVSLELESDWHVQSASSGTEGIEIAKSKPPDAILLDVMMPDIDGIETFRRLQSDPKTHSIPVIFLTAKAQTAERRQFQSIGIAGVITKPFNSLELAQQIANILGWQCFS